MIVTKKLLRKEFIQAAKQQHLMKTLIFMVGISTLPDFQNKSRDYVIQLLNDMHKTPDDFIDTLQNWNKFIQEKQWEKFRHIECAYGNHENIDKLIT